MNRVLHLLAALRRLILGTADRLNWLPPTLARLCVGWLFMNTGWGKLHHLSDLIDFFKTLGIPAPELQAPLAATSEFVCGTLILAGLLTRLASLPLVVTMIVAIATARKDDLSSIPDLFGFVEYLYILLLAYLAVNGPGPLSIDRALAPRLEAREVR